MALLQLMVRFISMGENTGNPQSLNVQSASQFANMLSLLSTIYQDAL
jgi:hypothetical protein